MSNSISSSRSRSNPRVLVGLDDAELDLAVDALGDPLEREAVVDALDRLANTGLDALGHLGGRVGEVGDVALPTGRPLDRLARDALLGARKHHVEGREAYDACEAEGGVFGGSGGGDADGHVERLLMMMEKEEVVMDDVLFVWMKMLTVK